jgi:hypothetical protein
MTQEFIPYQQALELKELGFDEPCFTYYFCNGILSDTPRESGDDIKYQGDCKFDNHQNSYLEEDDDCSAPIFSQAFRWFRKKYSLHADIGEESDWEENNESWSFDIYKYKLGNNDAMISNCETFNTYEEAELACLIKLIEIVKTK